MERIRQMRNEKGLSQAKLAVAAGMDPATLNRLEQGKGNPNLKTLERVADALGVEVAELLGKAQSRSSLEPSFNDVLEDERRESRLPEVADLLLDFAQLLLLTWEAELPSRAQANDGEWLANTAILWRAFSLSNYGVLKELSAEGLDDKQDWLAQYMARYMDINAAVHRINDAMREHSTADGSPSEEAEVMLKPLVAAAS